MDTGRCFRAGLVLLLAVQVLLSEAQDRELLDNKGNTFVVGFPAQDSRKNTAGINRLYITADDHTQAYIQIPSIKRNQVVTLKPGGTMAVDLPGSVRMSSKTGIENKGIRIWANVSMSVYGLDIIDQSSEGFLALPYRMLLLGNEYMVSTYSPIMNAVVMVIAALSGTEVTFILKLSLDGFVTVQGKQYRSGGTFKVTLDNLDAFQLLADSSAGSLTGTRIISTKAITVYSGNDCANVPISKPGCDHLVEQIPPLSTWGKSFLVKSTPQRRAGDFFHILASQNQTTVQIERASGGPLTAMINAGEEYVFDAPFNASHVITTSKPSLVVQYAKGHSVDGSTFAPFMSIIPPTNQFSNDYTLWVPSTSSGQFNSFAHIFASNRDTGKIKVKTISTLPKFVWKTIPYSAYSSATVALTTGQYHFYHESPLRKFSIIFYGNFDYAAFGFPAGLRVYRPESNCKVKAMKPADRRDNDCDGKVDEELLNGIDDDGDGKIDEDLATAIPELQGPPLLNVTDCPPTNLLSVPTPVYKQRGICGVRGNVKLISKDTYLSRLSSCWRQINREWTLTDGCLNVVSLNQVINIFTPNPLTIAFPPDIKADCPLFGVNRTYGKPVVKSDCAGNVAISYKDSDWHVIEVCGYYEAVHVSRFWLVTDVCKATTTRTQKLSFINMGGLAPEITSAKPSVSSGVGENITLPCTAEGKPPPTYTWTLPNGQYVNNSEAISDIEILDDLTQRRRLKFIQNDGSLMITESRIRDSGIYRCIVKNNMGRDSRAVNLTVNDGLIDVDISITLKDITFDKFLEDKQSVKYRDLADELTSELNKVFQNMTGFQKVEILGFRNGSVKVLFRVVIKTKTKDENPSVVVTKVGERLTVKIKAGELGKFKVVPQVELREKPPPPKKLEASDIKNAEVHVDWDPPDLLHMYAISGYLLQYKRFGDERNWMTYATVRGDNHRVDGLESGTSYLIRMKTLNKYGHSQPSTNLEVTTLKGLTSAELALIIIVPILVLIILVAVLLVAYRRRRKSTGFKRAHSQDNGVVRYSRPADTVKLDGSYTWKEIPRDSLELGRVLGEGEFGLVIEGQLTDEENDVKMRCAVKKLRRNSGESDLKDLLNELEIMVQVGGHPNIVNLIGACVLGDGPVLVVVEYAANGSLLRYLQKESTRSYEDTPEYTIHIPPAQRLKIASDVASGMTHLAKQRCVHRDLAARNVLLDETFTAKVSDFGMSRDVYTSAVYEKTTGGKLPAKWMAIEALEAGLNTTQSDVWSFGVLLWEIETGGCIPYPAFSVMEMLDALKHGYRLEKPASCSTALHNIMIKCWKADPSARPSFDDLYIELSCMEDVMPEEPENLSYYENMDGTYIIQETDA